jgi:hypothetical protein
MGHYSSKLTLVRINFYLELAFVEIVPRTISPKNPHNEPFADWRVQPDEKPKNWKMIFIKTPRMKNSWR